MNDLQSHKALTVKAKAATGSFLCVCSIVCNLSARKLWFKDYSLRRQSVLAAELPNPGARRTWAPCFISVIKTHKNEKATHTSKTLLKGTGTRGRAERCRWQLNLLPINYSAAEYETGVANFFCKGPGSKYFQLCGPLSLCHKHSCSTLLPGQPYAIHTLTNGHGYVPMKHCLEKQVLNSMWPNQLKCAAPSIGRRVSLWSTKTKVSPNCFLTMANPIYLSPHV